MGQFWRTLCDNLRSRYREWLTREHLLADQFRRVWKTPLPESKKDPAGETVTFFRGRVKNPNRLGD